MKQNKKQSIPSPSTQTYNELLCKVDTGRGAPMGRPSIGDRSGFIFLSTEPMTKEALIGAVAHPSMSSSRSTNLT